MIASRELRLAQIDFDIWRHAVLCLAVERGKEYSTAIIRRKRLALDGPYRSFLALMGRSEAALRGGRVRAVSARRSMTLSIMFSIERGRLGRRGTVLGRDSSQ